MTTARRRITVLIAEDEPIARRGLVDDLATLPEFELVGEAKDGIEALEWIEERRPDLVLLDVQMPGIDGFEVLSRIEGTPPVVIFVTAYDRYALKAFDVHALDYLLKPFDRERLLRALDRAKRALPAFGDGGDEAHSREQDLKRLVDATATRRRTNFIVRQRGRIVLVPLEEIEWIEARSNYVMVHRKGEALLERRTLAQAERELAASGFVRVHRSALVRVGAVVTITKMPAGDARIELSSGEQVTLSRSHRAAFESELRRRAP